MLGDRLARCEERRLSRAILLWVGVLLLNFVGFLGAALGQQAVGLNRSPLPLRPIQAEGGTEPKSLPGRSEGSAVPIRVVKTEVPPAQGVESPARVPQVSRVPLPSARLGASPEGVRKQSSPGSSKIDIGLPESSPAPSLNPNGRLSALPVQGRLSSASLRGGLPLVMKSPRIEVKIEGPSDVSMGVPQPYKLLVRNEDSFNVQGLVLRVVIPTGVDAQKHSVSQGRIGMERATEGGTLMTWILDELNSEASEELTIDLTAQTKSDFSIGTEWTLQPISDQASIQVRAAELELFLSGPSEAEFGQPCSYQLQVSNPGSADAMDVQVKLSAEKYGDSSTAIGNVMAGATEVIDVELVFHEKGEICIAAEATAAGGLKASSDIQVQIRKAELDLVLEAPETVYFGASAPYFVRITNYGDLTARQITARVELPDDVAVTELPEEMDFNGNEIIWRVNEIAPGTTSDIGFHLEFRSDGESSVAVECTSEQTHIIRQTAATNVMGIVDLKMNVTAPDAPAPVGTEVAYVLSLTNRGSKVAEEISVVALFSKDIEPTRSEGQPSEIVPGQVRFTPIERLLPGESVSLTVFAQAEADGLHRFRAEVSTPNAEVKLAQEETTQYIQAYRRSAASEVKPVLR